jgi:uncharacterized protein (TIGR04255 family)
MVGHVVQHRFRVKPNGWPLVQIGPGILTVNETTAYAWTDFSRRCEEAVAKLVDAYPAPHELKVQDLTLRYIDAVACDFDRENVFHFLRDKMKTTVALPESLFGDLQVDRNPSGFSWEASFPHKHPQGTITVRFGMARREERPVLVWETVVQSKGAEVPKVPDQFSEWLVGAHEITDDWFFKLIEGELERRFSGE